MAIKRKVNDFLIWGLFGVLIALLPLLSSWFVSFMFKGAGEQTHNLLVGGELFLISTGVSGEAFGKVLIGLIRGNNAESNTGQILAMAFCFLVLMMSILIFTVVSSPFGDTDDLRIENVTLISYVVFGAAIATGTMAIIVTPTKSNIVDRAIEIG